MSFFSSLLIKNQLQQHDGRPLWKYHLTLEDFEGLLNEFRFARPSSIDPRDATLFYAEWWKNYYVGGPPSKQEVFNALSGNIRFHIDQQEFYRLAKTGARMLGIRWIVRQNILCFRTLLLQGGLPLSHISANQGRYQSFLLAVLDEQPYTIEDFVFKTHIVELLPRSSQNDIIYESCLEIVKSILNDENTYDDLLGSNDALRSITQNLKIRKQQLVRRERSSKPKNYWILNFKNQQTKILLKVGLADTYSAQSLSNILGFEAEEKEYQFYLNERLVCVFRKMVSGIYKTDWYQQQDLEWKGEDTLPHTYVLRQAEKIEVIDFIETIPNLSEPTLWAKYSDTEWRLIKGTGTSNKEAAILFPNDWSSNAMFEDINIYNETLRWSEFEGEVEITRSEECRKYLSEVSSFEWSIVSEKPSWILKANLAVVQRIPRVIVYDEDGNTLPPNQFSVWVKESNSKQIWQELTRITFLPPGCIDIKIEKGDVIAYDQFFNIGNFKIVAVHKSIHSAEVQLINNTIFELKLYETSTLSISCINDKYQLKLDVASLQIPTSIKGLLGIKNQKKLQFEMGSPFEGLAIINGEGRTISTTEVLTIGNLYGLKILTTPNCNTVIRIKNVLKSDVVITKEINFSSFPLISFKEEIIRLYYLADAMDFRNNVSLQLVEGGNALTYLISGFRCTLNTEEQLKGKLRLSNTEDDLDLFAVPLNCSSENISLIPLLKQDATYTIPSTHITKQFIVISSKKEGSQLMPRFVNIDPNHQFADKEERICEYQNQLLQSNFEHEIWKQLLSYFNICITNDLPFSTFDQIRAISRDSKIAARAFLYLAVNQYEISYFIQKAVPEMELDLGFCFHWIKKADWENALMDVLMLYDDNKYMATLLDLISSYLRQCGLDELVNYFHENIIRTNNIQNSEIQIMRSQLGPRVLLELPQMTPKITQEYMISINTHYEVRLLLRSPIAVAESIIDAQKEFPIWGGNDHRERIRRNIQYSQYLSPEFYKGMILHVLKNN